MLLLVAAMVAVAPLARAEEALLRAFEGLTFTDDLDAMAKRRMVRALVVYSKSFYFIDRGRERGMIAEALQQLEQHLNATLVRNKPMARVHVVAVPVRRDQLISWLLEGRGDIAAANLTITPERSAQVDFTDPFYVGAREIVVTAPGVPVPLSLEDLSGREVVVRKSSSYYETLLQTNLAFRGKRLPIQLTLADERLGDEDLLEMVNAGLIPRIVVDDYVARLWTKVFTSATMHPEVAVARDTRIAWAIRKNSPKLKAALDAFVRRHKPGSAEFNDAYRRYFVSTRWIKNATAARELKKFRATEALFETYSRRYGFDELLIAAQAYQESGLDQAKRSSAGAIGVMQVLPSVGRAMRVGDIRQLEPNIHAGTKYLRQLVDSHFPDPALDPVNRTLFAFAAYNAGPTRINRLREEAAASGLDPNQWFNHVERIAARRIGSETVQYVANIFKYYIAYKRVEEQRLARDGLREGGAAEATLPSL